MRERKRRVEGITKKREKKEGKEKRKRRIEGKEKVKGTVEGKLLKCFFSTLFIASGKNSRFRNPSEKREGFAERALSLQCQNSTLGKMEPAEVQWTWVDFELGEDVRTESRIEQDQQWQSAVADGRAHVSWREYNHLHASEFEGAIADFWTVKSLVMAYLSKKNILLSKLNPEVLKHIIDFAMPGQGVLVFHTIAEYEKQQLAQQQQQQQQQQMLNTGSLPKSIFTNSSFRLCARCRPLLEYELEEGAYDCAALFPRANEIVLHDGKLARNGRRLTMTHKVLYHQHFLVY